MVAVIKTSSFHMLGNIFTSTEKIHSRNSIDNTTVKFY